MSARDAHSSDEEDTGDQFIQQDEILAEYEVDGDHPMDEDEEDDAVGDLPVAGSSSDFVEDTSEQNFLEHKSSIFTVTAHPTAPLAVSGGEDDLGYIWDITDGEIIAKLTGHTDSVSSTAFSADGEMVSTGGMDGKVRIWRRVGKENYRTWEFFTELQGPDEVMWLQWHPKGSVLLAGSNDTTVWLWQLPSGNIMQVFAGHTGPVQCGEFTPDGKRIVTACADGSLIFWDPRDPSPIFKLSADDARFNLDGITSLAVNYASSLAVVGGAAGGVRVVSLSKGEVVASLAGHKEGESVEAIQFVELSGADSGPGVVVTGGTDGKAMIWDLSTMRLRTTVEHEDAITTILNHPSPKGHLFVTASADKTLRTWDARSGKLIRDHKGHRGPILGASLGLEGAVVISAGDDGACLVFTTEAAEE